MIRLKDARPLLAGCAHRRDLRSEGVPGCRRSHHRRLFSRETTDARPTDVVLTTTPHIIRRSDIGEADLMPIWVGTEQNITFRANSPRVESEIEGGPFDEGAAAADRVRELIRQRVQELPPGLEAGVESSGEEGGEEEQKEQPPQGVDLVPPAFPTDTPPPPPEVEERRRAAGGKAALEREERVALHDLDDAPPPPPSPRRRRSPVKVRCGDPGSARRHHRRPLRAAHRRRGAGAAVAPAAGARLQLAGIEPVSWVRGPLLGADGEAELLAPSASPAACCSASAGSATAPASPAAAPWR